MDIQERKTLQICFSEFVLKHFPGGIIPSSSIDRKRFASLFQQVHSQPFAVDPEDESEFNNIAAEACVQVGSRFYGVGTHARDVLDSIFSNIQKTGANTIWYSLLHRRFFNQFINLGLASPQILAKFIEKNYSFPFKDDFFSFSADVPPVKELLSHLSEKILVSETYLIEAFPYIPLEEIKKILTDSGSFTIIKNGNLFQPEKIEFDQGELTSAIATVQNSLAKDEFISIEDLDFTATADRNPEIPLDAIFVAMQKKLAENGFKVDGKLIKASGDSSSLNQKIADFCSGLSTYTVTGVKNQFGKCITDTRRLGSILQRNGIQIDDKCYVNFSEIEFDSDRIDSILLEITANKPTTILSFISFSLLPPISCYKWNHFLLRSYFNHASKVFSLIEPSPNNLCLGIFYNGQLYNNPKYYDLAAQIAIADGISPIYEDLSRYVCKKGIFGRVRDFAINKLIHAINKNL